MYSEVSLVVLTILCFVGLVFGLFVALLKLIRDAECPLWTYRNPEGRKVHGFMNWWATLSGGWILIVVMIYNLIGVTGFARDLAGEFHLWLG